MYANTHAHKHTHTRMHGHTYTHMHVHAHTHGYTHTLFKSGVGYNIALHAWPAARDSAILVSAFLVHSTSFFQVLFNHKVTNNVNIETDSHL